MYKCMVCICLSFIKVDLIGDRGFVIFNCNNFDSIVLSAFQLGKVGPTFDYVGLFLTVDAGHLYQ